MAGRQDQWLSAYIASEKLGQEIMERINEYHQEMSRNSSKAASLATSIRTLMKKLAASTDSLTQALVRAASQGTITVRESEQRQSSLDRLKSTEKQLEQAFTVRPNSTSNRSALLGTSGQSSANPWLAGEESESTRDFTSHDLRSSHQRILEEQDRGLDALSKVVGRQREIAVNISAEVDIHNDILGEISEEMERADERLARETRNIGVVMRKSRTHWLLWLLIVLLLIAIVAVAAAPGSSK